MRIILLFWLLHNFLFTVSPVNQPTTVQINYSDKLLIINGMPLRPDDLLCKYVEAIGIYDRAIPGEQYCTFYFDERGITILVDKVCGKVEEIQFQFLPQRGAGGTVDLFDGEITINDRTLHSFPSASAVHHYFKEMKFTPVMDVLVMTQRETFNVGVVFTQNNELELCSVQFF